MNSFYKKYLKYKNKYSKIKKQVGGMRDEKIKVKDKEITVSFPDAYFCPIRKTLFVDPVITVDGITVEREAIEEWFRTNDTSPITGAVIDKLLIQNHSVRNSIEKFKQDAYQKSLGQQMAQISKLEPPRYGVERSPFVGDGIEGCADDQLSRAFPFEWESPNNTVLRKMVQLEMVGLFMHLGYDDRFFLKALCEPKECEPLHRLHLRPTFELVKETLCTLWRLEILTENWQGYELAKFMPLLEAHSGQTEEDFEIFSQKLDELTCFDTEDY